MPANETFTHIQSSPANVWLVTHNLSFMKPTVNVWVMVDGVLTAILPSEIKIMDPNTVRITFSSPHGGAAKICKSTSAVYTHEQTTPASTWNVVHNLNDMYVNYDAIINFENTLQVVLPQNVVITDANNMVVTFSSDRTGKVVVSS